MHVCVCVSSEEMKRHKTASKEQDLFPGITFASDMNVSQCVLWLKKIVIDSYQ